MRPQEALNVCLLMIQNNSPIPGLACCVLLLGSDDFNSHLTGAMSAIMNQLPETMYHISKRCSYEHN